MYLIPFAVFILYSIEAMANRTDFFSEDLTVFLCIYIYSSRFFNPDLDGENRPGKTTFPFGKRISGFAFKTPALKWIVYLQKALSTIWNFMWYPYSKLMTHRGISHVPIASVAVRGVYLWFCIEIFLRLTRLQQTMSSAWIIHWLRSLILLEKPVAEFFIPYCLPVYLADLFHTLIDLYDSIKAGRSFNSTPKEHHGLIIKIWRMIRGKKS